ncbi:MAG TPA: hypothetical protein VF008_17810 [Niastella sp.]
MKARNKKKTQKTGFKKLTVKLPRAKIKKRFACREPKDPNYITQHTQAHHAGRKIRVMKRLAKQGTAA